ncbi:MAG: divergent polysaccharide deacetylase family protein, partial [Gammaproteobacteria bacterium]|nr:divergent polysaccharide deacetylase family protein [Gammaproteobacteria bacterium]
MIKLAALLLISLCLVIPPLTKADNHIAVAIILDDIGHNYTRGRQALALKGAFTYAILPQTQHARQLAEEAHALNKEIMVHVPMESIGGVPYGTGGDGLDRTMTRREFDKVLSALIDSIPHASGVNNHQGSMLTQQTTAMHWLMDEVSKRRLYFVDSRTSGGTVARNIASVRQIFSGTRDVFLDVEQTPEFVHGAFHKLIRIARRNGTAIAI